ncbi:MAG TPA: acyltransferase [Candidatus Hydrogenedentes bacterium]|nr:acyltransferase [Candidatus Hydrogenedentota bacterium]
MGIGRIIQKLKLRYGSQKTVLRTLRVMGVRIGERCRVYTANFGTEPWLIKIGDHVCISNDVTFVNHGLTFPFQEKYASLTAFGPIEIKDNCQIGVRATILPNVTIGPNAIVGACSVVASDVPPNTVVAGNPARVVCSLEEYEQKCLARHIDIPEDREAARAVLEKHFWGDGP